MKSKNKNIQPLKKSFKETIQNTRYTEGYIVKTRKLRRTLSSKNKNSANQEIQFSTKSPIKLLESYDKSRNIECAKNNHNIITSEILNNTNYLMNSFNLNCFANTKNKIEENSNEVGFKFGFDWMNNKHALYGSSLFTEKKLKLFESEHGDFDRIYNDVFCSVKNFEKGIKNSSNGDFHKNNNVISLSSNPFTKITASRNTNKRRIKLSSSKSNFLKKTNKRGFSFRKNGYNFYHSNGVNISENNNCQANEEKSTEAFNEWYKSFYNFEGKNNDNSNSNSNSSLTDSKETQNFQTPTHEAEKKYKEDLIPGTLINRKGAEIDENQHLNEHDNFKEDNPNAFFIPYSNAELNDSANAISCFSRSLNTLTTEKINSNTRGNKVNQTNENKQKFLGLTTGKLEKESSIICKSKPNYLKFSPKPKMTKLNPVSKITENIFDLPDKNHKNNESDSTSLNFKPNNSKSAFKKHHNKFSIIKPEKNKAETEEKMKSTKEMFLANLIQFKENQPKEIVNFYEKIENYVNNLNLNSKDFENNESTKSTDDLDLENNFIKKYSLKDLLYLGSNINKNEARDFLKFVKSAKGTFIRNFLTSKKPLDKILNDSRIDFSEGADLLKSPNKFLMELMEFRNNLKENPSFKLNENLNDNKEIKEKSQAAQSKNAARFRSIPYPNNNYSNNPIEELKNNENNSSLKDEESHKQLNIKDNKELKDNINFEIDILSDANDSDQEDNSDIKDFLGKKHNLNAQQHTKNSRKKGFKYRMFSKEDKKFCLELLKIFDFNAIANFCNIPIKSLKRWAIIGPERKKGGGRKTRDPEMEAKLINWINEKKNKGEFIDTKMIKEKALELTKIDSFMASKGWFNKFQKKHKFELPRIKKQDKVQSKFFGKI